MSEDTVKKRLEPGDRVGKYEVVEYVARGGMGAVYKAKDTERNRTVALKVLSALMAKRPKMIDRFRREAKAASSLDHENIVKIYEPFGEHEGVFFLAMEYVPGIDLQEYIEKRRRLPPAEALLIITQSARALAHAHEQNIVHRDVKPSNFLLTRREGKLLVKLTDFGLAMQPGDEEYRLTREGTTVGTVDYMSPEQARKSDSADIRSDIYSLGCTFYHMLAGVAPFATGTLAERLLQHQEDDPPDIRLVNKEIPGGYVTILNRMLAKKPDNRYQSPHELLIDLEDPGHVSAPAAAKPAKTTPTREPREAPASRDVPVARAAAVPPRGDKVVASAADAVESESKPVESKPARRDREATRDTPRDPPRDPPREAPERRKEVRDPPVFREDLMATRQPPAPPARKRGKQSLAPWVLPAIGVGGIALVVVVAVMIALSGPGETKKDPPRTPASVSPPVVVAPGGGKKTVDEKTGPAGGFVGPERPVLAALYKPVVPLDPAALRSEFHGDFKDVPALADARVLRVSRAAAAGPNHFRSLSDALAAAPKGASIIEIHDQGPLFVGDLPPLEDRDIFLRAGSGYRPLLAWEPKRPFGKDKGGPVLLDHRGGGPLVIDGIDFVVQWPDPQAQTPACLFQTRGGLYLSNCTFSVDGDHAQGVVLARIHGKEGAKDAPSVAAPARLRLAHCYARGTDLTALTVDRASADVLIDDCLLVGDRKPLLRTIGRDGGDVKLRLVRSTLVAAQSLFHIQDGGGKGGSPRVQVMAWDAILGCHRGGDADAELIRLGTGTSADAVTWRAVNSCYAGWKMLLAGGPGAIERSDLTAWRKRFVAEGDRIVEKVWPGGSLPRFADLPAASFYAYDTPAAYAGTTGAEPIGAPVAAFRPNRSTGSRTDPRPSPAPAAAFDGPPPIGSGDGLYHGERIEVTAAKDLGALLDARLQGKKVAPRVVFHIAGSGTHRMTPLRVRNVADLVIYFEPAKDAKADPLILTVNLQTAAGRAALFEVEQGNLELNGVHVQLENNKLVRLAHVVKVTTGNLVLHRCRLVGPMTNAPDSFQALVGISGPAPADCRVSASVLLSGKGIAKTQGGGVQISFRRSAAVALGDALQVDLAGAAAKAPVQCVLDGSTWALRDALVAVKAPETPDRLDPVQIHATGCSFLDPFGDASPASTIVRLPEALLGRGQISWRGQKNAFDTRLGALLAIAGQGKAASPVAPGLPQWAQVWGRAGDIDGKSLTPGPPAKTAFDADAPQLDRLPLPPVITEMLKKKG